jgi:hypothetical protein
MLAWGRRPLTTNALRIQSTVEARRSLTVWLTSDRVLQTSGSGAAVANWLWPDGAHDGLYPEIAGYYLQFLSLAASRALPAIAAHALASRVIQWLDGAGPEGDPLTLYHRDMTQSDWRNKCLFAFDLAMILRGLASAEARWPRTVQPALMARYSASLRTLVDHGRLRSHNLRAGAAAHAIPSKWSTRIDVHHVKIAAALAGIGPQFAEVVTATLDEQAKALEREGSRRMRELHPFMYLIEGWLILWGQSGGPAYLDRASASFDFVLREIDPVQGTLPAVAGRRDLAVRSDVLAQALRAGLVLQHAGRLNAAENSQWPVTREMLQSALLSRVSPEGAIEFDQIGRHRNVWASLFAWQALDFLAQIKAGLLNAREAAASLI